MKQKIFTLLLIAIAGLTACKKKDAYPDIYEYDDQQIQKYIAANGLTGFTRDTALNSDTTGTYYKVLEPGHGARIQYSDKLSLVYSLTTMDGKYHSLDTIANHFIDYLGVFTNDNLPKGLQLAIYKHLKFKGGSMRLMIPSHLAYGVSGYGSGSVSNVDTRIAGNQSLDYFVRVMDENDQAAYDDLSIRKYLQANNLTGYTKTASGCYYKILVQGTGNIKIADFKPFTTTYYGVLFNGTEFDNTYKTDQITIPDVSGYIAGVKEVLEKYGTTGTSLSIIVPSTQGYGAIAQAAIPANSCLRFEYQIVEVTR